MKRTPALLLAAVSVFALNCDPPSDIGQPCALANPNGGDGGWTTTGTDNDLFENGATECIGQVCLRPANSPLPPGQGFCSDSCTPTELGNNDSPANECSGGSVPVAAGDGGIAYVSPVCRAAALDETFIMMILKEDGGAALLQRFLGGTTAPVLCTTPE